MKALLAISKEPVSTDSIATIQEFGVDEVIESGPGKVYQVARRKLVNSSNS